MWNEKSGIVADFFMMVPVSHASPKALTWTPFFLGLSQSLPGADRGRAA
jgi:hypothetical protein